MATTRVQNVTRASSDELLRKFADLDSETGCISSQKAESNGRKRHKRSRTAATSDHDRPDQSPVSSNGSLVERKSLLPPANRRSELLRQLGIGRPVLRSREIFISRSLMAKMEKVRRSISIASSFDWRHARTGVSSLSKWTFWPSFSMVRSWSSSQLSLLQGYRLSSHGDYAEEILEHGPSMV